MYRVIKSFADLEDSNHIYRIGDTYPRKGLDPTDERIEFLLSPRNLLGTPVIEQVKRARKAETKEVSKEEKPAMNEPVIVEESVTEAKPKRRGRKPKAKKETTEE